MLKAVLASLALALGVLAAACDSATPTPTPTATPSPTSSPTATATPTPTLTPTPTPTSILHPTGASDVLAQTETRGGFVPQITDLTTVPDFTLYGDGTLIYQAYDQEQNRSLLHRGKLTETAIQEMLRRAVTEARFFDSQERYDNPYVADAGTTRITVQTEAQCRSVFAYALGIDLSQVPSGMTSEDVAQLQRLADLNQWLRELNLRALDSPDWQDLGAFIPDAMNLFVGPVDTQEVTGEVMPWPFPIIDLKFFTSLLTDPTMLYLVDDLAHEVYQFLLDTPSTIFSQGDVLAYIAYRPHLPYEEQWRDTDLCTGQALS